MNNHKTACFIIVILVAGMLYGVNQLRNATNSAKSTAEASRMEAESAEQLTQLSQIRLKSLDSKTAELRRFYSEWEPHFVAFRSQQDAEKQVTEIIREGDIFLIERKFEPRELDKNALISNALVGDLIVEDDYAKTLNWIGTLEEKIPNCRITKCILTRGDRGNNIHLELQIQIPILST